MHRRGKLKSKLQSKTKREFKSRKRTGGSPIVPSLRLFSATDRTMLTVKAFNRDGILTVDSGD